jgi:hypothetical protein
VELKINEFDPAIEVRKGFPEEVVTGLRSKQVGNCKTTKYIEEREDLRGIDSVFEKGIWRSGCETQEKLRGDSKWGKGDWGTALCKIRLEV